MTNQNQEPDQLQAANKRLAIKLAVVAALMVGFAFALVPLYDVFCQVVGINSPRTSSELAAVSTPSEESPDYSRRINIEFSSQVMQGLPVAFYPMQTNMTVHPGENMTAKYYVRNLTNQAVRTNSIYSVTPVTVGDNLRKIECFCFKEQVLEPGEEREMPIVFYVDHNLSHKITDLALSYAIYSQPVS